MKKLALVTGATRGIGKSISIKLLSEGYEVIGGYAQNKDLAQEFEKNYSNLTMIQADFRSREETINFVNKLKKFKFDLIINNAGTLIYESLKDYDMNSWDQVISVNLEAPLIISQGLMNNIKTGGSIINISSTDHMIGAIKTISYAASKAGLVSLTKSLALNLSDRKIRVNSIAPNWVVTDMGEAAGNKVISESIRLTPAGRNTTGDDIANLVIFLASDKASFINGQTITLDGGYFAGDYLINLEAKTHK